VEEQDHAKILFLFNAGANFTPGFTEVKPCREISLYDATFEALPRTFEAR